ncbi:MAG: hypothetical protein OEM83_05395 [Gammaproteobacteria bacterium]|nr:hypothetical protein [Gammaproteobacteria bacterium]MDH5512367.1 hypothetical protein [Gammaproteobacteria bacterium]
MKPDGKNINTGHPTRALEPSGFMALNHGRQTPPLTLAAHVVYGAILGGC